MGGNASANFKEKRCTEDAPKQLKKHDLYLRPQDYRAKVFTCGMHCIPMFENLNSMRKSGTLTDVTLQCCNQTFHCHSLVLSIRSKFFRGILESLQYGNRLQYFLLEERNMSLEVCEQLFNFIYTGRLTIPKRYVNELFAAAEKWNLKYIVSYGKVVLESNTQKTNFEDFTITQLDFERDISSKLSSYFCDDGKYWCGPPGNITIATNDGEKFLCHREILASFSAYFFAMFGSSFCESSQDEVVLQDTDALILGPIIKYVYTSSIKLDWENSLGVAVATKWMMTEEKLHDIAEKRLVDLVNYENCIELYNLGVSHSLPHLEREASIPTFNNLAAVLKTDSFQRLSLEDLCNLLSSDHLSVMSEQLVFKAVLKWSETHDAGDSYVAFSKCVRLALMSHDELTFCISIITSGQLTNKNMLPDLLDAKRKALQMPAEVRYRDAGISLRDSYEKVHFTVISKLFCDVQSLLVLRVRETIATDSFSASQTQFRLEYFCKHETEFLKLEQYGVATFNNLLYITGGLCKSSQLTVFTNYMRPSKSTYVFKPTHPHCWSRGSDLQVARYGHSMVAVGDSLYVIGGKNSHDDHVTLIERLQLGKQNWLPETELPTGISNLVCAVWNDCIFVVSHVGGRNYNVLRRYSTQKREWLPAVVLYTLGIHYAEICDLVVVKEKMYLIAQTWRGCTMVSMYDPSNGKWHPDIQHNARVSYYQTFVSGNDRLVSLGMVFYEHLPVRANKSTGPIPDCAVWRPDPIVQRGKKDCSFRSRLKFPKGRHPMTAAYIFNGGQSEAAQ